MGGNQFTRGHEMIILKCIRVDREPATLGYAGMRIPTLYYQVFSVDEPGNISGELKICTERKWQYAVGDILELEVK